ncbi:MAG: hypothetical protein WC141_09225 [Arcobacteraceae bacterium]
MKKITLLTILVIVMAIDSFAGTGDAYGAKPIFDKIDGALNDTYVAAILTVGFLWKSIGVYKETGDTNKALPFGAIGVGIGSLGAVATGISGAIF